MDKTPTTRFVIEPLLNCNIKCKMCYHLHKYENWKDYTKTLEQVRNEIDEAKDRGNDYMDITGGEPTMYKDLISLIRYATTSEIKSCIITNGIVSESKAAEILEAGINDFLVSRHGLEKTHNFITNYDKAYEKQVRFLDQIAKNMSFRFNGVITKFNQEDFLKIAEEMVIYQPRVVNIINMNPHHEWMDKSIETQDVVADLRKAQPILEDTIEFLEYNHVVVNLRYYPMCRIKEEYRRCVCNDLQVIFDPYEWDYNITPKTFEAFRNWGISTSLANEEKGEPCCRCGLQNVCGGINKSFHKAANELYGEVCDPQPPVKEEDFYMYRKNQGMK